METKGVLIPPVQGSSLYVKISHLQTSDSDYNDGHLAERVEVLNLLLCKVSDMILGNTKMTITCHLTYSVQLSTQITWI